ncbi:hypothetical protein ACXITP_03530 [Actinotignum sanguinis]|uniref:Secreted protein n=2 Tax=Actinomycetaceae TaxID=2049 RepID=A0ABZ0RB78_9ACTO|nr:hypothetical protein [Actinotignum sanguinis]WPJ89361.1 hypothetical protein R0V15_01845 [Schaalia turicensis]MDE1552362.1 hypothetical protein [Actinotignum sanguinis]MDE1565992.1 hypothetical protein [Actinotignum sanguinis]MDE1577247.1 hypothetical protein [Actinotignum sanguinis]MDE1641868.1 hypothetical protein [Actinotignum sanguinis]
MPLIIVVIAIIIAAAALVYALSFARNSGKSTGASVAESFDAWRSDELDMDTYDIVHHDTAVDDMFEAFAHESEAYITSETLDEHFDRARETERELSETVRRNSEKLRARIPAPPLRRRAENVAEDTRAGANAADASTGVPEEIHVANFAGDPDETLVADVITDGAGGQSGTVDIAESFEAEDAETRERRSA